MKSFVELRDSGMRPLQVEIHDFNSLIITLKKYDTDFTRAYVYLDSKHVAYANREIGSREWNIRLIAN